MKLEVGKKYLTRAGKEVDIIEFDRTVSYPYFGRIKDEDRRPASYSYDGRYHYEHETKYDIVAES